MREENIFVSEFLDVRKDNFPRGGISKKNKNGKNFFGGFHDLIKFPKICS